MSRMIQSVPDNIFALWTGDTEFIRGEFIDYKLNDKPNDKPNNKQYNSIPAEYKINYIMSNQEIIFSHLCVRFQTILDLTKYNLFFMLDYGTHLLGIYINAKTKIINHCKYLIEKNCITEKNQSRLPLGDVIYTNKYVFYKKLMDNLIHVDKPIDKPNDNPNDTYLITAKNINLLSEISSKNNLFDNNDDPMEFISFEDLEAELE